MDDRKDCKHCKLNARCKKPWECEEEYQLMYLGRTFTKEEWEAEGDCVHFKSIEGGE